MPPIILNTDGTGRALAQPVPQIGGWFTSRLALNGLA
jgi:hypothetical protein